MILYKLNIWWNSQFSSAKLSRAQLGQAGPSLSKPKNFKNFLASLEVTEAGEAAKAKIFPKKKYGSKCLELPNSARKAKKFFSPL